MAVGTGQGLTVTFGTSSFAANIVGYTHPGASRAAVPTTHLGTTGGKTFIPSELYECTELQLRVQFDAATLGALALIDDAAEVATITFPGVSALTVTVFTTVITPAEVVAGADNLMEATISWKPSGAKPA